VAATVWIVAALVNGNSNSNGSASNASSSSSAATCEIGDFVISHVKTSWATNPGALTLTAVVTNNCADAAGPELTWTAYYGDGSVAFADQFWPASTVNIAPRQSFHFQDMEVAQPHRWKYTLQVAAVRQW
jgi:hypothetical protein